MSSSATPWMSPLCGDSALAVWLGRAAREAVVVRRFLAGGRRLEGRVRVLAIPYTSITVGMITGRRWVRSRNTAEATPVAQHRVADVADAETVDEHHARADLASPPDPARVELENVTVPAYEHVVARDAGLLGEAGVLGEMAVLAVDRHEVAGSQRGQQQRQLALRGMPGYVDLGVAAVEYLGALPGEVVHGPVDGRLVARDQRGGQHHRVARLDVHPFVLPAGHERQRGEWLAL